MSIKANNDIWLDANTRGFNIQLNRPNTNRLKVQFPGNEEGVVTKYITLTDS